MMGKDECGSCVADGIFGLSFLREVTGRIWVDGGGLWAFLKETTGLPARCISRSIVTVHVFSI